MTSFFPISLHSLAPPDSFCFCDLKREPGVGPFLAFHQSLVGRSILHRRLWVVLQSSRTSCIQLYTATHVALHILLVNMLSFDIISCLINLNFLFQITLEIVSTLADSLCLDLRIKKFILFFGVPYICQELCFLLLQPQIDKLSCLMPASKITLIFINKSHQGTFLRQL